MKTINISDVNKICIFFPVSDIQCTFGSHPNGLLTGVSGGGRDSIIARLRKPEGFRGAPLFADDRQVDPMIDPHCQIRPDPGDPTELNYHLVVTDFTRCGVLKRNVSKSLSVI